MSSLRHAQGRTERSEASRKPETRHDSEILHFVQTCTELAEAMTFGIFNLWWQLELFMDAYESFDSLLAVDYNVDDYPHILRVRL